MRQYESCIQIIIMRIKKKDKNEKGKVKKGEGHISSERVHRKRDLFLYFLIFAYLLDLWKSDHRFSLKQKEKLVYATRATRGYQNLSLSSNSKR